MKKIRTFVVSDSLITKSMITKILEAADDIEIVGEANTGQGGIIMLDEVEPHIVLLEVAIGGGMKINDIIAAMQETSEAIKIILCADLTAINKLMDATEAGAHDFIVKPYKKDTVLRVIREAAAELGIVNEEFRDEFANESTEENSVF